jgi:hypothetical protein
MTVSRKRVPGWWSASLLCLVAGTISACGAEHPDTGGTVVAAEPAAASQQLPIRPTPQPPGPRFARRPPLVRTMPNGRLALTPQEPAEVVTLQRQPDGKFKRVCGAPTDDDRAAMDLAHRNRGRTP